MDGNWTPEEKKEITKVFTVLATIQKTYGKEINMRETLQAWEYLLADKYPAENVIAAMKAYMQQSNDIPTPADLIKIMTPEKPKITQAEFIYAQEQHRLEGYPAHGYYGGIVRDYERQQGTERTPTPHQILESRKNAVSQDVKKLINKAMKAAENA